MVTVLDTDRVALVQGDCLEVLKQLAPDSIDAVVTDPPYGLSFMGKAWDYDVPKAEVWREVLRVLKPGGHLLSFFGSRTYHRGVVQIEDAGFEIRDSLCWLYGTGFPKSLNVGKAIEAGGGPESIRRLSMGEEYEPSGRGRVNYDHGGGSAMNGARGPIALSPEAAQWERWGTALKPAHEPIVLARKPLVGTVAANVLEHGTGALNINGCRIGTSKEVPASGRTQPRTDGWGMAGDEYTPGFDPNVGRWPANVVLDEDAAALLDAQSEGKMHGAGKARDGSGAQVAESYDASAYELGPHRNMRRLGDSGGASRFFYCAKASASERERGCDHLPAKTGGEATDRVDGSIGVDNPRAGAGRGGGRRNHHPTVKPIALMRWLVRLITPPRGTVLDPFTGSGTTGIAALEEGFNFLGIERDPDYCEIAKARLAHVLSSKDAA